MFRIYLYLQLAWLRKKYSYLYSFTITSTKVLQDINCIIIQTFYVLFVISHRYRRLHNIFYNHIWKYYLKFLSRRRYLFYYTRVTLCSVLWKRQKCQLHFQNASHHALYYSIYYCCYRSWLHLSRVIYKQLEASCCNNNVVLYIQFTYTMHLETLLCKHKHKSRVFYLFLKVVQLNLNHIFHIFFLS